MTQRIRPSMIVLVVALATVTLTAQPPAPLDDALRAIFERKEFDPQSVGPTAWLDGGTRYTAVRRGTRDLVAYDTATGAEQVLVPGSALVLPGAKEPMDIDEYSWSSDKSKLLLFTNTRKVWRTNSRGDYWVLAMDTGKPGALKKLGGEAPEASLMYAKFSPNGARVAYVRAQNIYVEDVASGQILPVTTDGGGDIHNGVSDWVNEEEFGIYDAFKWSPDGRRIAFWQFDTSGVQRFTLINNTAALYPSVFQFPYPKPGTTNSAVRVGVAEGGAIVWMKSLEPLRDHYIPRMDWADERTLVLQNMNRLQNRNDVLLADFPSGEVNLVHRDEGKAWVEEMDEVIWLSGGREFLWVSEKDGWRHAYAVKRDGPGERLLTKFEGDLASIRALDTAGGNLYFTASPANATQRYPMLHGWMGTEPCGASRRRTNPGRTPTTSRPTAGGRCTPGQRSKVRRRRRSLRCPTIDRCG
jgi:dipeptidyl-peptidase-4